MSLCLSVGPGKNKQTSVTIINGCQLFRWQFQMSSWCNFGWNVTIIKLSYHQILLMSVTIIIEFVISPGKFIFELCEAQNLSLRMSVGPGKNKQTSVTIINGCQLFRWQFQMSSWCNFGWNVTIIKLSYQILLTTVTIIILSYEIINVSHNY